MGDDVDGGDDSGDGDDAIVLDFHRSSLLHGGHKRRNAVFRGERFSVLFPYSRRGAYQNVSHKDISN